MDESARFDELKVGEKFKDGDVIFIKKSKAQATGSDGSFAIFMPQHSVLRVRQNEKRKRSNK